MKQSALIYCRCGHKIWSESWVELWREGGHSRRAVFFDDEETSETYAEQITRCPGCGKRPELNWPVGVANAP